MNNVGIETSHNLLIYSNPESKIKHVTEFISEGINRNEMIILIDDEDNLKRLMEKNHKVNFKKLEKEKQISITNSNEWYFPNEKFNPANLLNEIYDIVEHAKNDKRTGIRVFGDKTIFFRKDSMERVFECEKILETTFDLPISSLCAYMFRSMDATNIENRERLYDIHSTIIKETSRPQRQLRRNKLEIYFDILDAIREVGDNAVQTRVQGKSNLSYDKFIKYLDELRERNLILINSLTLTNKGREFVNKFDSVSSFLHKMGLDYIQ